MPIPEFTSEQQLEAHLTQPSDVLIEDLSASRGDLVILGAGGKMGPTLAVLARRALDAAGRSGDTVHAVSRWSDPAAARTLADAGVNVVAADLLADDGLDHLPEGEDVLFMVGAKFGASSAPSWAWQVNAVLPDRVARRYAGSRITAFSTGNVYPFVTVGSGGSIETDDPAPRGEYAMSCLGRERVFEHAALTRGTPLGILRLNYAVDLRYGVLCDIAQTIVTGDPVDLTTSHVNVVWQGWANEVTLRALAQATPEVYRLNLTGPEILSVETIARRLAEGLGREVSFTGSSAGTALLNDAGRCFERYGYPSVSAGVLIDRQAAWIRDGLPVSARPTKFAVRDGRF